MASIGYVETLLNTLEAKVKKPLVDAFRHVLMDLRLGTGTKAANFAWYRVQGVTSTTANGEFSIAHGLGVTPTWVIPVAELSQVNSQIVSLQVTRAPDNRRIYLASPSTNAVVTLLVEG